MSATTKTPTKVPITLRVLHGPRAVVAELEMTSGDGTVYVFAGDAKCHPNDKNDPAIGESYAVCRALREAADNFEAFADWKVETRGTW